jgi:hypothetical protein
VSAAVAEAVGSDVEDATDVGGVAQFPDLALNGQHPAQPGLTNLQTPTGDRHPRTSYYLSNIMRQQQQQHGSDAPSQPGRCSSNMIGATYLPKGMLKLTVAVFASGSALLSRSAVLAAQ